MHAILGLIVALQHVLADIADVAQRSARGCATRHHTTTKKVV